MLAPPSRTGGLPLWTDAARRQASGTGTRRALIDDLSGLPRMSSEEWSPESSGRVPSCPLPCGVVSIRVVLADDSVAMRDLLAQILDRSPDIDLVATADDEPTLLAAIEEARPDVVVTDVRMPPTGTDEGVRVAVRLATTQPHIGVVIVSQYCSPGWLSRVFDQESENRGWVMKERVHLDGQLISAVRTVHQGDRWIDPSVMAPD